ncbi:MAG: tetratricopeptide repeat protein [Bacteroidota bacterium]|nr:tetratricopeptide repeat protein [Bacteroidota bacterium]
MTDVHQLEHWIDLGRGYERRGQWLHAIQFYRRALEADIGRLDVRVRLAVVYSELGDLCAAEQILLQALGRESTPEAVLSALAMLFYRYGDDARAGYYFEKLLPYNPLDAHVFLGLLAARKGDDAEAEQRYRRALMVNETDERVRFLLAETLLRAGKADQADAVLNASPAVPPEDWRKEYYRGAVLVAREQWQEARAVFDRLVMLRPEDIDILCASAVVYLRLQDTEKADILLRQAARISPDAPQVLDGKGLLALARGHRMKALTYFRRALDADPTDIRALEHVRLLTCSRQ